MTAILTPTGAANPSALTTAETLEAAHDEIAILHGLLGSKTEALALAFTAITELFDRVEKLETA